MSSISLALSLRSTLLRLKGGGTPTPDGVWTADDTTLTADSTLITADGSQP